MPSVPVSPDETRPWAGWWPERLAPILAIGGVVLSILPGFHPQVWPPSATDFKTVYAATWNLVHHVEAYTFPNIAKVFARNDITPPGTWFSHAPVYPPFTLAVLSPLASVSMVSAIYLFMALSALAIAAASAVLARAAWESFQLNRIWRFVLIGLVAATPLVTYGLSVGNVSVLVAASCIYAVAARQTANPWLRAAALTLGLLLKPHVALWVLVALALAPSRRGRAVALRTCIVTGAALAAVAAWLAAQGQLVLQTASYIRMVRGEMALTGSMNATSHEILTTTAQITALKSLFGYWYTDAPWMLSLATPIVILLGLVLVWLSLRRTGPEDDRPYDLVGAWCGFGLLATYHRAHDAIVLLVLLPWLLARLRRRWSDVVSWLVLISFALMCLGPDLDMLGALERTPPLHVLAGVFLRQSPFFACVLTVTLVVSLALRRFSARQDEPLGVPPAAVSPESATAAYP